MINIERIRTLVTMLGFREIDTTVYKYNDKILFIYDNYIYYDENRYETIEDLMEVLIK